MKPINDAWLVAKVRKEAMALVVQDKKNNKIYELLFAELCPSPNLCREVLAPSTTKHNCIWR